MQEFTATRDDTTPDELWRSSIRRFTPSVQAGKPST